MYLRMSSRLPVPPRYVPHYDLLDPATGRSIRDPRTGGGLRQRQDGGGGGVGVGTRFQREIQSGHRGYLLPIATHFRTEAEVGVGVAAAAAAAAAAAVAVDVAVNLLLLVFQVEVCIGVCFCFQSSSSSFFLLSLATIYCLFSSPCKKKKRSASADLNRYALTK